MGMFGKYLIELILDDGQRGFFMEVMDGCLTLTQQADAACRFLTNGGARGYYESIYDLPELITGAHIAEAYVVKVNSL